MLSIGNDNKKKGKHICQVNTTCSSIAHSRHTFLLGMRTFWELFNLQLNKKTLLKFNSSSNSIRLIPKYFFSFFHFNWVFIKNTFLFICLKFLNQIHPNIVWIDTRQNNKWRHLRLASISSMLSYCIWYSNDFNYGNSKNELLGLQLTNSFSNGCDKCI